MSNQPCCPLPGKNCRISPVVHLFRRCTRPRDHCEPQFGLQDLEVFYRGCFAGVFKRISRDPDKLILKGNPPLDATDAWLIPGSTRSGFVINRSWRMGAVTFYEVDDKKMPTFDLSILDSYSNNLISRIPGVAQNERVVLCGDKK